MKMRTLARHLQQPIKRLLATEASPVASRREDLGVLGLGGSRQKKEGTIEDIFTSFTKPAPPLPARFASLKRELFHDGLVQSWREVLAALAAKTEEVATKGTKNIPQVDYASIVRGLSPAEISEVKRAGVVIVKGGVSAQEALAWKQSIREYIAENLNLVKGSPSDKMVFYEIYNSKVQIAARTHPALVSVQRALCELWHVSDPATPVSLSTPLAYFDRLRIRDPGPSVFALDAHIDGGSIERWEDPGYRSCFGRILEGRWREHDPFDASPRLQAKQDLYDAPNQCTVFLPWQGWTSLSSTGPGEGTLRVLPFLHLSTAYIILRPFFKPTAASERRGGSRSTEFNDWEINIDGPEFPGSEMGKAQILNELTHPHLRLDKTVTSIPPVEPGDQVYWHCDLVHAVERQHVGAGDSSVLYIPAVPVTASNAAYLRNQLHHFQQGLPPPDFPGGEGESGFIGRATPGDVRTSEGRRMLGLEPYHIPQNAMPGAAQVLKAVNGSLATSDKQNVA